MACSLTYFSLGVGQGIVAGHTVAVLFDFNTYKLFFKHRMDYDRMDSIACQCAAIEVCCVAHCPALTWEYCRVCGVTDCCSALHL